MDTIDKIDFYLNEGIFTSYKKEAKDRDKVWKALQSVKTLAQLESVKKVWKKFKKSHTIGLEERLQYREIIQQKEKELKGK